MFMKLKAEGELEGKSLEFQLDIMRSFVILTALPKEWNKETKHTCICRSFFKHSAIQKKWKSTGKNGRVREKIDHSFLAL